MYDVPDNGDLVQEVGRCVLKGLVVLRSEGDLCGASAQVQRHVALPKQSTIEEIKKTIDLLLFQKNG